MGWRQRTEDRLCELEEEIAYIGLGLREVKKRIGYYSGEPDFLQTREALHVLCEYLGVEIETCAGMVVREVGDGESKG